MRILFLLKERNFNKSYAHSYGLANSAIQVANYLETIGNVCKVISVVDGNAIDKEVYNFKPDIVIIEALWCPAYKLKELIELKRYENINWVVRVHSDIGFLSSESLALTYINEYIALDKTIYTLQLIIKDSLIILMIFTIMNLSFYPILLNLKKETILKNMKEIQ